MYKNILNLEENDLNRPIYRIFSKERFFDLIKENKNGLVKPKLWDDPFENFFLKCPVIEDNGALVSLEAISENWYGQCWTFNEDSDAMWRIYSASKNGIKVCSTVNRLFSHFYQDNEKTAHLKYFLGKVNYQKREEIEKFLRNTPFWALAMGGQMYNFAKTLLMKRNEFSHENEVRLLFFDSDNKYKNDNVAQFSFPVEDIIERIELDPRLEEVEFKKLKEEILNSGFLKPISQSELYKFTSTPIKLS